VEVKNTDLRVSAALHPVVPNPSLAHTVLEMPQRLCSRVNPPFPNGQILLLPLTDESILFPDGSRALVPPSAATRVLVLTVVGVLIRRDCSTGLAVGVGIPPYFD
jgi:hypothetical protein